MQSDECKHLKNPKQVRQHARIESGKAVEASLKSIYEGEDLPMVRVCNYIVDFGKARTDAIAEMLRQRELEAIGGERLAYGGFVDDAMAGSCTCRDVKRL